MTYADVFSGEDELTEAQPCVCLKAKYSQKYMRTAPGIMNSRTEVAHLAVAHCALEKCTPWNGKWTQKMEVMEPNRSDFGAPCALNWNPEQHTHSILVQAVTLPVHIYIFT